MKKPVFLFCFMLLNVLLYSQNYNLVWEDQFNKNKLNLDIWQIEKGNGCPDLCGWGNNEIQHYSENNLSIENGFLTITALKSADENNIVTSAKIQTLLDKSIKYGKVEVRAKLPSGKGTWPAIWMLPSDWNYGGWPKSGEIDIMEHVGYAPNKIYGTVHTEAFNHIKGTQVGDSTIVSDAEKNFHVYGIEWTEEKIDFFVDDLVYFSFNNTPEFKSQEWPFDKPFYLIINLAIGGNWGGKHGINQNIYPAQFVIDYVKVYQKNIQ